MLNLKNETKKLFKKAGLENFTVARSSNGFLELVGECGKPLVQITNFAVSSKLSKKEREICIDDYIQPTLITHSKTLLELVDAKRNEIKTKENVNLMEKDAKKHDFDIKLLLHGRYSKQNKDIDTYGIRIIKNIENAKNKFVAALSYSSNNDIDITVTSNNTAGMSKTVQIVKDCNKNLDDFKIAVEEYVKALLDVRLAQEKLRVECEL